MITDAQLLQPTPATDEIRRFDALDTEEQRMCTFDVYADLLGEVKLAMGVEFARLLDDAVGGQLELTRRQTLDRLVIGLLDHESVAIEELRTTRRTAYVPELRSPGNACEAADELYVARLAEEGRVPA